MKTVYLVTYRRAKDGALAARIVTGGIACTREELPGELATRCGARPGQILISTVEDGPDVYRAWRAYYMSRRIWEGTAYMDYQTRGD